MGTLRLLNEERTNRLDAFTDGFFAQKDKSWEHPKRTLPPSRLTLRLLCLCASDSLQAFWVTGFLSDRAWRQPGQREWMDSVTEMKMTSHLAEGEGRGLSACLLEEQRDWEGATPSAHPGHPVLAAHCLDGTLPLGTTWRRLAGRKGWAAQDGPMGPCRAPSPSAADQRHQESQGPIWQRRELGTQTKLSWTCFSLAVKEAHKNTGWDRKGLKSACGQLELPPISLSSHVLESIRDRSCHQKSTDKAKKKHRQGGGAVVCSGTQWALEGADFEDSAHLPVLEHPGAFQGKSVSETGKPNAEEKSRQILS